jgi:hypothetical protein
MIENEGWGCSGKPGESSGEEEADREQVRRIDEERHDHDKSDVQDAWLWRLAIIPRFAA